MKRIVFGLALLVSGCASVPSPGDISAKAKEIQGYTRLACSFVPTIATIASILSSGAGSLTTIAQDICAAVTTAPLADGPNPQLRNVAQVNGVAVAGRFVK